MGRAMKFFAPAAGLVCLLSCGGGLFMEMDRLTRDPTMDPPAVRSFAEENLILVDWSADEAADDYVLERAADSPTGLVYSAVYQGTGTSFTDADCEDQTRYLYRLRKIKGNRLFDPSIPVLGVGSVTCNDGLEPNDSSEQATPLVLTHMANIYYYRTFSDEVVRDVDWYSVAIPAGFTANITITQISPPLGTGDTTTYVLFGVEGLPVDPVTNNEPISISNTYSEGRAFNFQIIPDPARFLSGMGLAGGTMVKYRITLVSIYNM